MFKHPLYKQLLPLLAAVFLALTGAAQTCTYTINMFDSFGDGWNGGVLTVVSNGVTTTHTIATGGQATATFQVTAGQPVTISWAVGAFAFEPYFEVLDPDGIVIVAEGASITGAAIPVGVVYDEIGYCPVCPALNINLVTVPMAQLTDSTALVNWPNQSLAESWNVEYGPAGFPLGTGISLETTSSDIALTGLNPCVDYDVYISTVCGVDSVSSLIGPIDFTTTYTPSSPGATCEYTFNLFDSFGDGWNGCELEVTHDGTTFTYTIPAGGDNASFTLTATSNLPIEVTFVAGNFLNEVTYEILDPNGDVIFSDGPFPLEGEVFTTIACPTCPGPTDAWMSDVNANNARFAWQPSAGAQGNYIIEYGPMGFTRGTGTVVTVPTGQLSYVQLTGLAENSWYNAYIVLDCGTEFSKPLGPVMFKTIWLQDLGVSGITAPTAGDCDLGTDEEVIVNLTNYGQVPQTLFEFYFSVNGQLAPVSVPQDGLFTGVLGNDSTQVLAFETTWDFSAPGIYHLQAWTVLEGDSQPKNDTFSTFLITAFPKPMKEDFEDNAISSEWTTSGAIFAPNTHNNPTRVLGENLYSFNPLFDLTTFRVGPIAVGDSLKFDYRYVDFFDGTTATELSANDQLEVLISDDCQDTWQTVMTIDQATHVTSTDFATQAISLSAFEGKAINVRFEGTWGAGDYWLDLDNINITGCPESLFLLGNVQGSVEGDSTGIIDLSVLLSEDAPFEYEWTNAAGVIVSTDEDPTGLPVGTYTVAVTSASGCTGSKTFTLGIFVGAAEVDGLEAITLYPNPTDGTAFVDVKLLKNMDVQLRLLSLSGQTLFESQVENTTNINQPLDLSGQAPGMYILQVVADGKPYHAKLMVAR